MDCTFFGESTGLYFYSAVFQGNMALLGLLAVFYAFFYQQLKAKTGYFENKICETSDFIRQSLLNETGSLRGASDRDIKRFFSALENNLSVGTMLEREAITSALRNYRTQVVPYMQLRNHFQGRLNTLPNSILLPFVLTAVVIVLSLASLLLVHFIHVRCSFIELVLFLLTILIDLCALFLNSRFFYKTIKFGTRYSPGGVTVYEEDDED